MNDTLSQWRKQNIKANDWNEKVLKCERQLEQTYSYFKSFFVVWANIFTITT